MLKQQRGAAAVMDMSLFVLLLLSGFVWSDSGFPRKYFYINESMSWTAAQSYCRAKFTDLATVDSMDDVNRMMNTVNDGYSGAVWIGLKMGAEYRWGWSTGDDLLSQYSAWGLGQPTSIANCGYFAYGYWYNSDCSSQMFFACYDESVGNIMINQWKTWRDAQTYCRQHYTDLAIIRSAEEQKQLYAVIGNGPQVWIGLFWTPWLWSDQWSHFYRNWADTLISNECVAMSTTDSGKWVQNNCEENKHFICYEVYKKQIIRLNLSCDGNCDLNDPSLQTVILNQIRKKLQSMGLGNYISLNWGKK